MVHRLLYAQQIPPLSDILRDLDIVTTVQHDEIEKIQDGCTDMISEYNAKELATIFDKLAKRTIVNAILKLDIAPINNPVVMRTATINHASFEHTIGDIYARTNMYSPLYYRNVAIWANNKLQDAIRNGLRIQHMMIHDNPITNDTIECCTSLVDLSIFGDIPITTFAPFAKTLRTLFLDDVHQICDDTLSPCTNIVNLNVSKNRKITTCAPFAKSLKRLRAEMYIDDDGELIDENACAITDISISLCTNIEILYVTNNINITTCAPFAHTLEILHAESYCGITDDGLFLCTRLYALYATGNACITTCAPFADTLEILYAEFDGCMNRCGITDAGLSLCTKICKLRVCENPYTSTCTPFAHTLKILNVSIEHTLNKNYGRCMSDAGLTLCSTIYKLNANHNPNITTCAPFAKSLEILDASYSCGISDAGLSNCIAISELYANGNSKITTCKPFAKTLTKLCANMSGIGDNGISRCISITYLDASDNSKITTCEPFAKSLIILHASTLFARNPVWHRTPCGIGDAGLKMCHRIKDLRANDNQQITTCDPFAHTLNTLFACGDSGICNKSLQLCNSLTYVNILHNEKINKDYIKTHNKNVQHISGPHN